MNGYRQLLHGIRQYQAQMDEGYRQRRAELASGQNPKALIITCSDSRVNLNLVTQTWLGDLFLMRNAGNIVPPHSLMSDGAEAATIEYAVNFLGVENIIICGHSYCGAMAGLMGQANLDDFPAVRRWLRFAESTKRRVLAMGPSGHQESLTTLAAQQNVLVQLDNLCTHPSVANRLRDKKLRIHGWMHSIESGGVSLYDENQRTFIPVSEVDIEGLDDSVGLVQSPVLT